MANHKGGQSAVPQCTFSPRHLRPMSPIPEVVVCKPSPDEEVWIVCGLCSRLTCHTILTQVACTWRDDDPEDDGCWQTNEYMTLACRGCRSVSFCVRVTDPFPD